MEAAHISGHHLSVHTQLDGLSPLYRSCGAEMLQEWIGWAFPELCREYEHRTDRNRHGVWHSAMGAVSLLSAVRQPASRDVDDCEQSAGEKNGSNQTGRGLQIKPQPDGRQKLDVTPAEPFRREGCGSGRQ